MHPTLLHARRPVISTTDLMPQGLHIHAIDGNQAYVGRNHYPSLLLQVEGIKGSDSWVLKFHPCVHFI